MTNEEWMAAYYPTPAHACPKDEAVAHSIRKWEGIAFAVQDNSSVPISVDASTCALCMHYYGTAYEDEDVCTECPLALSLGRRCEDDEDNDEYESPWGSWCNHRDPLPMLNALKAIPS